MSEPLPEGRPASFGEWVDHYYPDLAGRLITAKRYEAIERQYRYYLHTWELSSHSKRDEIASERERLALERERLETERMRRDAASRTPTP